MKRCIDDDDVMSYFSQNSTAELAAMCKDLSISLSTGRRVLSRLEKGGKITRYRGGAFIKGNNSETLFDRRRQELPGVKNSIARIAAMQVVDGSCIMLLGGTTVASMCPYLTDKKLTVITNSLAVLEELSDCPDIKIVLLGGYYNHLERELHGNMTNSNLKIMHADDVFISCVGFSPSLGYTTNDINSIEFYRTCLQNSNRSYALCDHSKCGKTGIAVFAQMNDIQCLITDAGMNEKSVSELERIGIKVIIADL
jgi:DeoR family fructose operon transcriptional repressor